MHMRIFTPCCATKRDDFRAQRILFGKWTGLTGFFRIQLDSQHPEKSCQPCLFSFFRGAVNLARFTALEIRPTWLNACGKLPRKAPLDGSICSGSNPSALVRLQSEWKRSTASSNLP